MGNEKNRAICILGMHRSGTSAIARAVNLLGPYIGRTEQLMQPVKDDNPHGFWEHQAIFSFHERLLPFLSMTWDSVFPPLGEWWKRPEIIPYREELKRLIQEEFNGRSFWMWKDPRTSILLPLWKEVLQELEIDVIYLLCVRNPLDVAASLERRNNFSKKKSLSLWFCYNISALYWSINMKGIVVRFDALIENWEPLLRKISSAFQIPWPQDEEGLRKSMVGFLRPRERHSCSDDESVFSDGDAAGPTAKLYHLLLEMIKEGEISGPKSFAGEVASLYDEYREYSRIFAGISLGGRDGSPPAFGPVPVSREKGRKENDVVGSSLFFEPADKLEVSLLIFPVFSGPRVSIIIPVWNHWDYTLRCLRSILADPSGVAYEVIVVDNGSTDRTGELLAKTKNIRIIQNASNAGYLLACNQGAEAAQGDYLVFLNNDTEPLPGWLIELVKAADADPKIGAVGAKLIYPDGRLQEAGGMIFSDGRGWNFGNSDNPDEDIYNVMCDVDYCSGACLLVRKNLFASLGGFDVRYAPAYYEETDLCFGLRKIGYRVLYDPNAVVIHHESVTAGRDVSAGFKRYIEINRQKFVEKWKEELAGQDAHPLETGRPPITACRERLGRETLLPEDVLDALDKKMVRHGQYFVPTISDKSLLYRSLDEMETKAMEVISKTVVFYSGRRVGIAWTGSKNSVAVLHLAKRACTGTAPIKVIHIGCAAESHGEFRLLEKLSDEWGFELRTLTDEGTAIQPMSHDGHRDCEWNEERAFRGAVETLDLRALIMEKNCDEKSRSTQCLYFSREKNLGFMRVQPMLHFRELDIWQYIKKYDLPFCEAGLAGNSVLSALADEEAYTGPINSLQEFKAAISVEEAPSSLAVYTASSLTVKINNTSNVLWPAQIDLVDGCGISLSYHWIDKSGKIVQFDGVRTPLTKSVGPGGDIVLEASVITPLLPGEYSLEFDMVQEGVAWFKDRGSKTATVVITVENSYC